MIKGIVFDVGGTLSDFYAEMRKADRQLLKECGIDVSLEKIERIVCEIEGKYAKKTFGMTVEEVGRFFARMIIKKLSISPRSRKGREILRHYNKEFWKRIDWGNVQLYPDVLLVVKKLRTMFMLSTLSNTVDGDRHRKNLRRYRIPEYVELNFNSADLKIEKPDERAFLHVLKRMKLRPDECMMVGDMPYYDILGGNRVGMKTVLINRRRIKYTLTKDITPDYEIRTLRGLFKIPEIRSRL